ncbi:AI-2E family transporter [Mycolicibacterium doricum]|uniref:AI-2E family transporter n=1 Tax=Mycolicibacterium doricum TaxID=126673 RepID=A0A7I7VVU7_9MYCO|nr:AI-2E family transporter [Mycolicibacterium doricum]
MSTGDERAPDDIGRRLTSTQQRALAVFTVLGIAFGAYFLRAFFILIVVAAVAAYLFAPLYERLQRRLGTGLSATLTLLAAVLVVIVPVSLVVFLAIVEITQMVDTVSQWMEETDVSTLGDRALEVVNDTAAELPYLDIHVTPDTLRNGVVTVSQRVGEWLLAVLQGALGGVVGALAATMIFLYVFISLLTKRDQLRTLIGQLNPLGEEITDLYLEKTGAMVRGTVMGQFVIAVAQGVAGAISIYVAGFHEGIFFFAVILSTLSVIPLGSGVVTIPFGIGMALFGNVVGGLFVVGFHLIAVTNIDNFLRPILVPRAARLDPALMLLAVFSGIAMFGFWGIVLGPVMMIIIVTTISVYLAVYRGVPLTADDDTAPRPADTPRWWRWVRERFGRRQPAATPRPAAG